MAVSMRDVAQYAGVSQRTVSNVVNDFVHVRPETRAKVLAAIQELGYEPNSSARSLRTGRTGQIRLLLPDLTSSYFAQLAEDVVVEAEQRSLTVLIELTHGRRDIELRGLAGGGSQRTDGAIMFVTALEAADFQHRRPEFPVVAVGSSPPTNDIDSTGLPNYDAALAMVRHLTGLGRRRIAIIGTRGLAARGGTQRYDGYRAALREAGLPVHPDLAAVTTAWSRAEGQRAMSVLLALPARPDAVFAMNDELAIGALREALRQGVAVPEEISVSGFDDIDEAAYTTPPLTTVAVNIQGLASAAVELVLRRTAAPDALPRRVVADFYLQIRKSTSSV